MTNEPEPNTRAGGAIGCETCRFWDCRNEHGGWCRRNPPQLVVLATHDPANSNPEAHFPWTDKAVWCGEYKSTQEQK